MADRIISWLMVYGGAGVVIAGVWQIVELVDRMAGY